MKLLIFEDKYVVSKILNQENFKYINYVVNRTITNGARWKN